MPHTLLQSMNCFLFKTQLNLIAIFALVAVGSCSGATAFLLVQGEFDSGSAGLETGRWQVNDPEALLLHGQKLLDAVFGAPQLVSGTAYSTSPISFIADNTTWKVNYTFYAGFGFLLNSFERNSSTLVAGANEGWNYYVAGGTYVNNFYDPPVTGSYDNEVWTPSDTGPSNRSLLDINGNIPIVSPFDAWVFGSHGYGASSQVAEVAGFLPISASFSGATVNVVNYSSIPEPSRSFLFLAGLAAMLLKRRRTDIPSVKV